MEAIRQKTQRFIPTVVLDIAGALFFLMLIWGSSYLFLLME